MAVLTDQTTPYPRWDVGALGNAGLSFASFSEWLSKSSPNTTAFNIGITTNAFANLQQRKYFWRNNGNLTLGWIKFNDRDDPEDSKDFKVAADWAYGEIWSVERFCGMKDVVYPGSEKALFDRQLCRNSWLVPTPMQAVSARTRIIFARARARVGAHTTIFAIIESKWIDTSEPVATPVSNRTWRESLAESDAGFQSRIVPFSG